MAAQLVSRSETFVAALASAMLVFIALVFLRPAAAEKPSPLPGGIGQLVNGEGGYVGSLACASCHQQAFHAWAQSQHAFAMADATDKTVRGDFNNVTATQAGSTGRFYRDQDRFLVETENKEGKADSFLVSSVFGVEPLQQYLVQFPDGRVQVLPWAWDTRPKSEGGQRWFAVYGDEPIPPSDTRHWTGGQQNWNYMCAECHSTALRKNYDDKTDRFATRYSEISVGCEACHGPAGAHMAWTRAGGSTPLNKGFAHKASQRAQPDWSPDPVTGNPRHGVSRAPGDEVETCARCHARRSILSEDWKPGQPIEETHLPSFLSEGLFEADGLMRDEVFNDHSFKQSLMYAKGVVCSDCHDPHSAKLKAPRAEVCGQCHQPEKFSSVKHTGHQGPQAPDCIGCHMPARTYMVVDKRHDHSFRIPRPDLSLKTGGPNACNDCHKDQSAAWAADTIQQWHGPNRRGFQIWGDAFAKARKGDPTSRPELVSLIRDLALPALVRATAIAETLRFPTKETTALAVQSLNDPSALVRVAALRATVGLPAQDRVIAIAPRLSDPVRAVRIEAAQAIASSGAAASLPLGNALAYERARGEAQAALELNTDRPEARAGLAQFAAQSGNVVEAEERLRAALAWSPDAAIIAINLADLYRATGREADANAILSQFIARNPNAAAARHAYGLSLVRQKKTPDAVAALQKAYEEEPFNTRYAYVYGVALQSAGSGAEGRAILEKALLADPWNVDLNNALLADALRSNDADRAAPFAARLSELRPDDPAIARLSNVLNKR